MSEGGSLAHTLSSLDQTIFRYFHLKEFHDSDYDPRNNPPKNVFDKSLRLTKEGLKHTLTLANWLGKQMSDFKDNFLFEGDRSEYVKRKAGEIHQILDQVEDVRARLTVSTVPIIRYILNKETTENSIKKLLTRGHDITDLVERCTLGFLDYIAEFDPRGTATDYHNFLKDKIGVILEKIEPTIDYEEPPLSWIEFKGRCLNKANRSDRQKFLAPLLPKVPPLELKVLTKRYGLDGENPENTDKISERLSKDKSEIIRLELTALIRLGMQVDKDYFIRNLSDTQINVIERKLGLNGIKMRNVCIGNDLSILPYKVRRIFHETIFSLRDLVYAES